MVLAAVSVGETFWGVVSALAVLAVGVVGLPFLLGGGGQLRGRRSRRGYGRRHRMRYGPGAPAMLAAAMARRLDTVLLVVVTVAIGVLIVVNATA